MAARDSRQVHSISTLPPSAADDRRVRARNYIISMTIRTLGVVFAGVFMTVIPWTPGAWICMILGIVLPYPAVIVANNVDRRQHVEPELFTPRALDAAPIRVVRDTP